MTGNWHCCMPGHAWGDDGWCARCGAYEPEKRVKKVEHASTQEVAAFALRMVVERMQFRIDAMNERDLPGVSISKGFAAEIVRACRRGAELLENPEPAQAGLTAGGGSGSANVSEGVTGGGERAVGDAAGEIGGHLAEPKVDDPAAPTLLPCPFCGGAVRRRDALWPSDGDSDAVIHAELTDCPLQVFSDGTWGGGLYGRWNAGLQAHYVMRGPRK